MSELKKIFIKAFPLVTTLLLLLANVSSATTNCWWGAYQPEVPESLRK
ncbi:MAG: cyclic lactone autoinducer peptide [Desulfotomaculaceae bacterium]|nr:cyclic lactone autoinducer peptide [Desulfotomaculaceae bacterium]